MTTGSYCLRLAMLGILSAAACVTAQASDFNAPRQVHVRYADLDVASATGAKLLYRRISFAANTVCEADSRDLNTHSMHERCMQQAVGGAVRDVNVPQLSRLFAEKNGPETAARFGISEIRTAKD